MESIGELAQRTATSRRMLRHWETQGLLTPAAVDPRTNERRYAPAQAGRVRTIAALRAVGFGLDAIRDLLEQGLTESRLLEILRQREVELVDRIAEDSASLAQVRTRLRSIERDRNTIMSTLTIDSLPAMTLHGVTEIVADETEIPEAAGRLLAAIRPDAAPSAEDVFMIYDGTTDPSVIRVFAGVSGDGSGIPGVSVSMPSVARSAAVELATRPINTADAWVALDSELASRGLRATGPYRQILHPNGAVTLATPVSEVAEDC